MTPKEYLEKHPLATLAEYIAAKDSENKKIQEKNNKLRDKYEQLIGRYFIIDMKADYYFLVKITNNIYTNKYNCMHVIRIVGGIHNYMIKDYVHINYEWFELGDYLKTICEITKEEYQHIARIMSGMQNMVKNHIIKNFYEDKKEFAIS